MREMLHEDSRSLRALWSSCKSAFLCSGLKSMITSTRAMHSVSAPDSEMDLALQPIVKLPRERRWWVGSAVLVLLMLLVVGVALLLRFGGYILFSPTSLPSHAQVAVVLQGSEVGEAARRDRAFQLLQDNTVQHVLLSVPQAQYLSVPIPELLRNFVLKTYGPELAKRAVYCEQHDVFSTIDEALALQKCIKDQGWTSIIVVTSTYHTRRAGMIWRTAQSKSHVPFEFGVDAAYDPDFDVRGWWRRRRSAKTWLLETTKLGWGCFESGPCWYRLTH